jgi:hypothetical protein
VIAEEVKKAEEEARLHSRLKRAQEMAKQSAEEAKQRPTVSQMQPKLKRYAIGPQMGK